MAHPLLNTEIGFCPDLDRGAIFLIQEIEENEKQDHTDVTLRWIKGRWSPSNGSSGIFKLKVPKQFTENHIEGAFHGL